VLIWWRSAASGLSKPSSSLAFDTPSPSVATRMSASSSLRVIQVRSGKEGQGVRHRGLETSPLALLLPWLGG
jgi:hypothetical protein